MHSPFPGQVPVSRGLRALREAGGAVGDMGTFVPHVLGAITVAGLPACGVLAGFGVFYLASGLVYRVPVPVQPMKAVSAVLLTSGLTAAQVAATGLWLGALLLLAAATGVVDTLARAIPRSVTTGLQLGLGLSLGMLALHLMGDSPMAAGVLLAAVALMLRVPGCPAALIALAGALAAGQLGGLSPPLPALHLTPALPFPALPGAAALGGVLTGAVLPQLALTLTNAIIVTAALASELLGAGARRVTPRHLALSTGVVNLLLAPFGALPMCHGAGGLAAHYRFGARTGAGIAGLGVVLLATGLLAGDAATALMAAVPKAAVGALLAVSALELAWSRRLLEARPACVPVIGITAAASVLGNPLLGLACGWLVELAATRLARRVA